jgi:hypothetical protein
MNAHKLTLEKIRRHSKLLTYAQWSPVISMIHVVDHAHGSPSKVSAHSHHPNPWEKIYSHY